MESDRAEELAEQWDLIGEALPQDWPDVPIPRGSEVLTAFAIGAEPLRTWTATFAGADGTALDFVDPVVAQMRARDYKPIEEFVGKAVSNTGLFSFSTPTFSVYLVLGEDAGRPNMVMTIRGATPETSQPPTGGPR